MIFYTLFKKVIVYSYLNNRTYTQKQRTESGRSMLEMLAVLAIIGILAIISILGYRYAMHKNMANTIIQDAYLGYTSMLGNKDKKQIDWMPVQFEPKSGKPIDVSRDLDGDNYVRVREIEQDICKLILQLAVPNKLMFYDETGEDMLSCSVEENIMIFAFDGTRAPGVNCESGQDCTSEGDGMYCNTDKGICRFCPDGFMISSDNDDCWEMCEEETETTCVSDNKHWCCNNTLLCGEQVGECIESDGFCEYTLREQTKETEFDCSYAYQNQTKTVKSDCSYHYTEQINERYAECSYTLSGTGTDFHLSPRQGCPTGMYCYLSYKDENCTQQSGAEGANILYGTCTSLALTNPTCRIRSSSTVLTVREGCPTGLYCYLSYKDENCEQKSGSEGANVLYGTCTSLAQTNPPCRVTSLSHVLTPLQKCPDGLYCYLGYSDKSCKKALGAKGAETIYGACTSLAITNPPCPIKSLDTDILQPVQKCPSTSYCYLQYASPNCENPVNANGANPFYGVCLPKNSNRAVCPIEK